MNCAIHSEGDVPLDGDICSSNGWMVLHIEMDCDVNSNGYIHWDGDIAYLPKVMCILILIYIMIMIYYFLRLYTMLILQDETLLNNYKQHFELFTYV